jgi:aldehyde dehydrogenase (NAD+)
MTIAPADPRTSGLVTENTQLIGGDWVPAASGETIAVVNPATGKTLMHVPRGAAADVDAAVNAAQDAFPQWRDTRPTQRAALLMRWGKLIDEHERELDLLETSEVGRPHWGPLPMARMFTFFAGQADKVSVGADSVLNYTQVKSVSIRGTR